MDWVNLLFVFLFHLAAKYTSIMYLTTSFLYCTVHNPEEEWGIFLLCFRLISVDKGELNDSLALYTSIAIWFPNSGIKFAKSKSRTDFTSPSSQGCSSTRLFLCTSFSVHVISTDTCFFWGGNYLLFCPANQSNGKPNDLSFFYVISLFIYIK